MQCTWVLALVFLIVGANYAGAKVQSPCPYTFAYKQVDGVWYGFIRLIPQEDQELHRLQIRMSIATQLTSVYVGKIERLPSPGNRINCALYFRVHFPSNQVLPYVEYITHNNKIVCSGPSATGEYVTTLGLEHTTSFRCDNSMTSQLMIRPRPSSQSSSIQQSSQTPIPSSLPQTSSTHALKDICGIPSKTTSLVVHGQEAARGVFPWLAAIYFKGNFTCGGTLISSRHIVTAAHCIEASAPEDVDDFVVFLGKHKLREPGAVRCVTDNIYVHPDYQKDNWNLADADIAMITVREVMFTRAVKPVCVFLDPVDLEIFVGQLGTLAGWGRDEFGRNPDELRQTTVSIVDQKRCKASHIEFANIKRSFCAGGVGSGPCNGDSGGGLFVRFNQKWFLRGIVSTSLSDLYDKSGCNVNNYALYTDVCRFTEWVNKFFSYL